VAIPREIVYTRHPGRRGTMWLAQSFRMFRAAPLTWLGLVVVCWFLLGITQLVPLVGPFLAPTLVPVFGVGLLAAAWTQERGGAPRTHLAFQGFRANLATLLPIGIALTAGISIAALATTLIDGGRLLDLVRDPMPANMDQDAAAARFEQTMTDPRVHFAMLAGMLCALPTVLAIFWAPALVVFQDAGVGLALAVSLRAAIANWRPLLRFALIAAALWVLVPYVAITLLTLLLPPAVAAIVMILLIMPYAFGFLATLAIADYVSYRDVFHIGETLAPLAPRPSR
jgi:hypothetical protein